MKLVSIKFQVIRSHRHSLAGAQNFFGDGSPVHKGAVGRPEIDQAIALKLGMKARDERRVQDQDSAWVATQKTNRKFSFRLRPLGYLAHFGSSGSFR